MHDYLLYGARLRSHWPFPYDERRSRTGTPLRLHPAQGAYFASARSSACILLDAGPWVAWRTLTDNRVYIRWQGLLEAVVAADGRSVACRPLPGAPREMLHGYLLGATVSFALIRQGVEPLHATVVVVDGAAVGLMGDCGYGKSSLAGAFLAAGHRVLTDDLLVLTRNGAGLRAHPGAPRLKLFPAIARRIFGAGVRGTRMNRLTPKLIIPLNAQQRPGGAVPLRALYVLAPPRTTGSAVALRRLSGRQACLELVRNTFNMALTDGPRLARLLAVASDVSQRVPVKRISYPRRFSMLAAARDAILADLSA